MNIRALRKQIVAIYKTRGGLFLLVLTINAFNNGVVKRYFRGSYSQKGEDLVIEKIIGKKKKGFYVDVGAHNPELFNNTKRFYDKGWRGINIEPNPLLIKALFVKRKRDINLNIGIKKQKGVGSFYEFEADSLSTFSKKEKDSKIKLGYKLKQEHKIKVLPLMDVLKKHGKLPIDFISVDTEGLDLEVLQSNDWKKYRPTLVCVETGVFKDMLAGKKKSGKKNLIDIEMSKQGYQVVFTNGLNTIYQSSR